MDKFKDRFINTLDELNRSLKRRNISLIDTINEAENRELEYNGEKTERIFLASSNEYRYSQMHIKQSVIEKLSKEKLQKIYDARNLSKSKSSSVPIHLSNEEIKENKSRNNKDDIFNKLSNYNLNRRKE